MELTPELVISIVTAVGVTIDRIAKSRTENARIDAEVRSSAEKVLANLVAEERTIRQANDDRHAAEIRRLHREHATTVARIRSDARTEMERAWNDREISIREEFERQLRTWRDEVSEIVREIGRKIIKLDPYRTPTTEELAGLKTLMMQVDISPSYVDDLINGRQRQ